MKFICSGQFEYSVLSYNLPLNKLINLDLIKVASDTGICGYTWYIMKYYKNNLKLFTSYLCLYNTINENINMNALCY